MRFVIAFLLSTLSGCATMDAGKASAQPTAKLCEIVLTGTDGWNGYDAAGQLAAEQEAARRGADCNTYSADISAKRAAMGQAGQQMLENSGWSSTPRPALGPTPAQQVVSVLRTTCGPPSNGSTFCTTYYSDGTHSTTTCYTAPNGSTTCR
jgi:hypothetical protein